MPIIKIIKCSNESFWYKDLIDESFYTERKISDLDTSILCKRHYLDEKQSNLLSPDFKSGWIYIEDCSISYDSEEIIKKLQEEIDGN